MVLWFLNLGLWMEDEVIWELEIRLFFKFRGVLYKGGNFLGDFEKSWVNNC